MRSHPSLSEKAESLPGISALFHAKDLNFHRSRLTVIDRERAAVLSARPHSARIASSMPPNRQSEYIYHPAWWIPGPHAQTLWGKFFRRRPTLSTHVERWTTPDGDFLDLHRLEAAPGAP